MATNLIETILKLLTSGDNLKRLASYLGLDEGKAKGALAAAVPALLAALIKKSSTQDGAAALGSAVDEADEGIFDKLGDLLGGGGDEFANKGGGLLDGLLGKETSTGLGGALEKFTGLGGGGGGKLAGALAPLLLGSLKKEKAAAGLDAGGLASLLGSQKSLVANAMPDGLGDVLGAVEGLGIADLAKSAGDAVEGAVQGAAAEAAEAAGKAADAAGDAAGAAAEAAGAAADAAGRAADAAGRAAAQGSSAVGRWLLPLIIALLAVVLIMKCAKRDDPPPAPPAGAALGVPVPAPAPALVAAPVALRWSARA